MIFLDGPVCFFQPLGPDVQWNRCNAGEMFLLTRGQLVAVVVVLKFVFFEYWLNVLMSLYSACSVTVIMKRVIQGCADFVLK